MDYSKMYNIARSHIKQKFPSWLRYDDTIHDAAVDAAMAASNFDGRGTQVGYLCWQARCKMIDQMRQREEIMTLDNTLLDGMCHTEIPDVSIYIKEVAKSLGADYITMVSFLMLGHTKEYIRRVLGISPFEVRQMVKILKINCKEIRQ